MLTYGIVDSKLDKVKPLDEELVCEKIEDTVRGFGLTMAQKTTLSTKKGCSHWHFKKGKEKGVLEVTYWPKRHALWLDIHDNRRVDWNVAVIGDLAAAFAGYFGGRVEISS
ncbi:hypothetical protein EV207_1706 [Scopulibacillus darangshiensis]|uniref:Uncharacterized protein n=1 Tax=Scopulibacillus darangshiensis TaxID=442528 RepID=A0A4R2NBZ1_9BACL|nr:hypothetical protein [Scopulibacillus darangshiensis]TCP18627.1 hypothetical protein EV207_1706 [Scopulibacillus darangshiensis]